jgi:MFS family permease
LIPLICITLVGLSVAQALVFLALPLLAIHRFDALNVHLGLLGAVAGAVYMLMSLFSGRISERLPIRGQLMGAAALLATMSYVAFLSPSLAFLIGVNVALACGFGLLWAPLEGAMSRLTRPSRMRANMGWYNLSWSSGMSAGFFLFSLVESYALHVAAALFFASCLALLFLRAPNATRAVPIKASGDRPPVNPLRRPFLLLGWSGLFAGCFAFAASRQFFPKLATECLITDSTIGLIVGTGFAAQTIGMVVMGRFGGWHYRRAAVYAGEICVAAACVLIAVGRTPAVFTVGQALLGFAIAILYSCSLYYSLEDPADAHRNTSVHEALMGLGHMTPLVSGYIADRLSLTPVSFYIAAGAALFFLGIQVVLQPRRRIADERMSSLEGVIVPEERTEEV